jgi:hypothetical protein
MTPPNAEPAVVPRRASVFGPFDVWLGLCVVLLPLVVAGVMVLAHAPATAIRDHALTELRVRDVGIHPVLLGLYSRDGWSHPGPLAFFTLAAPYRIFGSSTSGIVVGALGVNALSIAGMTTIARRVGGRRAALVLLVCMSVLVHALGADLVRNPWVLFISVFPFGLFCCVIWALVMGRAWALPVGAFVGSWLVQAHVGYAPMVVPMLLAGAVALAVTTRRSREASRWSLVVRASLLAVGVLAVLWALPIWDQLFGSGNVATTIDWFSQARDGVHTVGEGMRVVFGQFAAVPDWVTGERRIAAFNGETLLRTQWLVPVLLVPFVGAVVVAWRRRDAVIVRLAFVVGGAVVLGVVAVARTIGIMYEYRLLWTWVVGALAAVVVAWTLWDAAARRWPRTDAVLVPVVLLGLVALGVVEIAQATDPPRADWDSPAVATAIRQLVPKLDPARGQIVLSSKSVAGEWSLQGVLLALDKAGFDVRVRSEGGGLYPKHLVVGAGPIQDRLSVVAGSDLGKLDRAERRQVVAYGGPQPLDREVAMLHAREAKAARQFERFTAGEISEAEYASATVRLLHRYQDVVAILRTDAR